MLGARRRRRRRPAVRRRVGTILLVLVAVLVTAFLVLSIRAAKPSAQSVRQGVRTYVDLVYPLVEESNHSASVVQQVRTVPTQLGLITLRSDLGELVSETARTRDSVEGLSVPSSMERGGGDLTRAMRYRASAAVDLQAGMTAALDPARAGAATSALVRAGDEIDASNRAYSGFRGSIPRWAGGRRAVPTSQWISDAGVWSPGAVSTFVSAVGSSTTGSGGLAPDHDLLLLLVSLQPTPLSTQPQVVLPTTNQMSVTLVVADIGNEPEGPVHVRATLEAPRQLAQVQTATIAHLNPGQRVSAKLGSFSVAPGDTYTLSSEVTPAPGETKTGDNSVAMTVQVSS